VTLEQIVTSVKKVSDIISEIAAAGQEQAAGIEQVNKAVTQMDEMTQQNAALVEEAAAASKSMEEQSKELNDKMAFFTVNGDVRPSMVANTSLPVAQVTGERRGEDRPFSSDSKATPQNTNPPVQKKTGTGDDDTWEEF
jgi:methyl-accepting chemotaxis protein